MRGGLVGAVFCTTLLFFATLIRGTDRLATGGKVGSGVGAAGVIESTYDPQPPELPDPAHVALAVHDLDRSLAFYAQLGLREAFRLHHPDGRLMLVYLHVGGDRFLELFPGASPPDRK